MTAFAAFTCGSGLLSACTSAPQRKAAATIGRCGSSTPPAAVARVAAPGSAPPGSAPPLNVYAYISPGMTNPKWGRDPSRVYVPNSLSNTVSEIDPATWKVTKSFATDQTPDQIAFTQVRGK